MKRHQHTLKKAVTCRGVGLHSGMPVTLTLCPAQRDTGICFRRTDLKDAPDIPARAEYITESNHATALKNGTASVSTAEHILSALYALEIDNCLLQMDSQEPPVCDGGSLTFTDMILRSGIAEQEAEINVMDLPSSFAVYEKNKFIAVLPYEGFRITYTSINPHPLLGTQMLDITVTPESYKKEIAGARTIGFTWELDEIRKLGLGKGCNLQNALVYSETKCLSESRWPDELVRHKILDIMGDLSLVGPFRGHIIAVLSSHKLNGRLASKLLDFRKREEI